MRERGKGGGGGGMELRCFILVFVNRSEIIGLQVVEPLGYYMEILESYYCK